MKTKANRMFKYAYIVLINMYDSNKTLILLAKGKTIRIRIKIKIIK